MSYIYDFDSYAVRDYDLGEFKSDAHTFDIKLDDELKCVLLPRTSAKTQASVEEAKQKTQFRQRRTEKGGVRVARKGYDRQQKKRKEGDHGPAGDDMDPYFADQPGGLPSNANRDIERLMHRFSKLQDQDRKRKPHEPRLVSDYVSGYLSCKSQVLVDRDRRLAFGYDQALPMSLAGGHDGGVDLTVLRWRRPRPCTVPRCWRNAGKTPCLPAPAIPMAVARVQHRRFGAAASRSTADQTSTQMAAAYMARQPAVSGVHAALRFLT